MNIKKAYDWFVIWKLGAYITEEQGFKIEQRIFDCLDLGINEVSSK